MYDNPLILAIEGMKAKRQRIFPSILDTLRAELEHSYNIGAISWEAYAYASKLLKNYVDGQ